MMLIFKGINPKVLQIKLQTHRNLQGWIRVPDHVSTLFYGFQDVAGKGTRRGTEAGNGAWTKDMMWN